MNEMKLKPKYFFLIILFICVIFYLLLINKKCDTKHQLLQSSGPTIFAITPTYARPAQKAELTRLAHTIMLVPNIHWIIVEDASSTSKLVENILKKTELNKRSTLISAATPENYKLKAKDPNWKKPRGVAQRNAGITWIRSYIERNPPPHSLVYFMDDDNTYSLELFHEIGLIKPGKVGVWPVGLVGGLMVEKPVLNGDNEVIGFNSVWHPERPFPIDMAGFAIATDLLQSYPEAEFSYDIQRGYQESEILRHLTVVRDLQPMANFCKEVLVWHTRTESPKLDDEIRMNKNGQRSNDGMEV